MTLGEWLAWVLLIATGVGFVALFCWAFQSIPFGLLMFAITVVFGGAICWAIVTLVKEW